MQVMKIKSLQIIRCRCLQTVRKLCSIHNMTVNLITAYRYVSLLFMFARNCEISAQF